jgi:solute carrier family 13 (sodium-dependent dicarboxylate transporter), member 2/3/5
MEATTRVTPPPARERRNLYGLAAGALAFLLLMVVPLPDVMTPEARRTAAVAALMATWWMTEALPLHATALLPLVAFPVLGILSPAAAAAPFANPVIFLFLGGFLLAAAMERWALHRRIALGIVGVGGLGARRLILGFMSATAFLSMWISNTATAAMMIPIAIALAQLFRPGGAQATDSPPGSAFATALMLGVAYAATIGGLGTLIGTPPNAVLAAAAQQQLGEPIGFFDWMLVGVPAVLILLPACWALLVFGMHRPEPLPAGAGDVLRAERARLGGMSRGEKLTAVVFAAVALGWILREPKPLGAFTLPGLTTLAPGIDDATIAIAGAILLFLLPVDRRAGLFVLDAAAIRRVPWEVLLLFGGGLSLARGFEESGLSTVIGSAVGGLHDVPVWVMLLAVAALFNVLSELASNTAIASMAMPLLAAIAVGTGQDPLVFMAAGALSSSAAFMLPVGTPPNAIAFGTGYIRITQMMRTGVLLNLAAIAVTVLLAQFVIAAALR